MLLVFGIIMIYLISLTYAVTGMNQVYLIVNMTQLGHALAAVLLELCALTVSVIIKYNLIYNNNRHY